MQPVDTGLVLLGAYTQPVTTEMVIIIPVPTGYCHRELRPVRTESMKITVDQSGHYRFYSRINPNRSVPKTGIVQILSPLSPFYYTHKRIRMGSGRELCSLVYLYTEAYANKPKERPPAELHSGATLCMCLPQPLVLDQHSGANSIYQFTLHSIA